MLSRWAIPQLVHSLRRAASTAVPAKKPTMTPVQPKEDLPAVKQAPNCPTTWTTNQRPRPGSGSSPRFEQTNIELQPNPLSAMELISNEPVRIVHGRKAVCDGGPYPSRVPRFLF
ncbi:Lactobacillus shifted protein [Leucoagaricus sp. SymC.cos]|nr:Lactobacillus shifted protein [Leucoagaricus sp. SymC.cos]